MILHWVLSTRNFKFWRISFGGKWFTSVSLELCVFKTPSTSRKAIRVWSARALVAWASRSSSLIVGLRAASKLGSPLAWLEKLKERTSLVSFPSWVGSGGSGGAAFPLEILRITAAFDVPTEFSVIAAAATASVELKSRSQEVSAFRLWASLALWKKDEKGPRTKCTRNCFCVCVLHKYYCKTFLFNVSTCQSELPDDSGLLWAL